MRDSAPRTGRMGCLTYKRMSDDPQTPSPDDGSDAPFSELSETELDDILGQAGSLADQLSAELGHAEEASAGPASDPVSEKEDEALSLDDELAQLEGLVTATSREVGEPPDSPPEEPTGTPAPEHPASTWDPSAEAEFKDLFPGGKLPPRPPLDVVEQAMVAPEHLNMPTSLTNPQMQPPVSNDVETPTSTEERPAQTADDAPAEEHHPEDDVPDFMREFMDPEPEAPPESPSEAAPEPPVASAEPVIEATPVPVQMKPGVVGTGMLRKVVRPDQTEAPEEEAEVPVEVSAFSKADALRARLTGLRRLLEKIPSPAPALSRIAYIVCAKGVAVLEKADKPMERIGYRLRTLIGWIAMATLGTSVIVYVVSLF